MNTVEFNTIIKKNNVVLGEKESLSLNNFVELLLEWNTKINLISRKDVENIWQKHILGSLSLLFKSLLKDSSNIIDIGCGGGFPGIPLAICLPGISFTLVDSIQKKINVVTDIVEKLQLQNVKTICGRAEELCLKPEHSKKYDYVTARAVAPVADVVGWTKKFLKPSFEANSSQVGISPPEMIGEAKKLIEPGSIVIFKGGDVMGELEQTRIKYRPKSIETIPLIIEGIDPAEFSDKKLVIVKP